MGQQHQALLEAMVSQSYCPQMAALEFRSLIPCLLLLICFDLFGLIDNNNNNNNLY